VEAHGVVTVGKNRVDGSVPSKNPPPLFHGGS
jgi:hypothetical protein